MIKVDFKGFNEKMRARLIYITYFRSQTIFDELAKFAAQTIYRRVKSGYGVTSDTAEEPGKVALEPLYEGYIKFRQAGVQKTGKGKYMALGKSFGPGTRFKYLTKTAEGGRFSYFATGTKRIVFDKTGAYFSPAKSNLTLTGRLLDAIDYRASKEGFRLFIRSDRRPDGMTNKEVAEDVSKKRPFFALTDGEIRTIAQKYQAKIRELARSLQ